MSSEEHIVRTGSFLYAGTVRCELRVVRSPVRYGSGDHEDPEEIANDLHAESFYVEYGSPVHRSQFQTRSVAFPTLLAAMHGAVEQVGQVNWSAGAE